MSTHFRSPLAAIRQLRIKAAWGVVHSGHEQFENAGVIDPEHLQVMRRGQLDVTMKLAKVEDGTHPLYRIVYPAKLATYEQAVTKLISMTTRTEPE